MIDWHQALDGIRSFVDTGGPVLIMIAVTALLLWLLLLERVWDLTIGHRNWTNALVTEWQARTNKNSWFSLRIRDQILSQARLRMQAGLSVSSGLIALCPMLGLIGTVSGMIGVFDIVATEGSSDARAMADGIARATLPTLAGMVVAVSALGFRAFIVMLGNSVMRKLEHRLLTTGSHP